MLRISLWEEMKRPWPFDVLITVALLTLLSVWLCWGAILERGVSSSGDTGSNLENTLTFVHNSGSGETDCVIFVGMASAVGLTVDTVTYAGQALSKISESSVSTERCEIWMRLNPATGSNDVFLERVGSTMRFTAGAITLCGVDQGTPHRTPTQEFGGITTNVSHDVTSGTGEVVLGVIANAGSANGVTTGVGQTEQWNDQTTNATTSNNVVGVGSTEPGASLVTIQYGQGASENYDLCTVSIRPAGVVGADEVAEGLQPIIQ